MTAPRLEIDLQAIRFNARTLVDRLAPRGVQVTGVTKAVLGAPEIAAAMVDGGAVGIGDARVENLARVLTAGSKVPRTLIRSPMRSQADTIVRTADTSMNTEEAVLVALSSAALHARTTHGVIVMVELGDLREGVVARDLVALTRLVGRLGGLRLVGIGTNLACQSGVAPDQATMDELSTLASDVEASSGHALSVVSGGNSANLAWCLGTDAVGRVNDLRLGESILLGTEPLHRCQIDGLRTDACTLVAEVIEVQSKPAQPWGTIAQGSFGTAPRRTGTGTIRQAIAALGRQDTDPDGLRPPNGVRVLGMSSDHLVMDVSMCAVEVGDELRFGLDYSALVRAATSPFVAVRTSS